MCGIVGCVCDERVAPILRATQPSSPSDREQTSQSDANSHVEGPVNTTSVTSTGVASSRAIVTAFAGVASADGPNVEGGVSVELTVPPS